MKTKFTKIPNWFDISNYDEVNNLDDNLLINQYKIRRSMLQAIENPNFNLNESGMTYKLYSFIVSGQVNTTKAIENYYIEKDYFPSVDEVKPVNYSNTSEQQTIDDMRKVLMHNRNLKQNSLTVGVQHIMIHTLVRIKRSLDNVFSAFGIVDITKTLPSHGTSLSREQSNILHTYGVSLTDALKTKNLFLEVHLSHYTDKELVTEFEKLLRCSRLELGISEPARTKPSHRDLEKLREYQLIAIADLLIYQKVNNFQIKKVEMCLGIFGHNDRDWYEDTALRRFKKMFAASYDVSKLRNTQAT